MDRKGKEDQRILDVIKAYQETFSTEAGQLVLYDLMERGFFLKTTLQLGDQRHEVERKEGRRDLVCYIMSRLDQNPEALRKFIETQNENRKEYQDEEDII